MYSMSSCRDCSNLKSSMEGIGLCVGDGSAELIMRDPWAPNIAEAGCISFFAGCTQLFEDED